MDIGKTSLFGLGVFFIRRMLSIVRRHFHSLPGEVLGRVRLAVSDHPTALALFYTQGVFTVSLGLIGSFTFSGFPWGEGGNCIS